MAFTIPSYTKVIDDTFTQTWFDIKGPATDQILDATVITAWMRRKGCYTSQEGGNSIEMTLEYALPSPLEIGKGDTLNTGETETRTAAYWNWRNLSIHIQRSLFGNNGDQANRGKYQIQNYVTQRLERATEALKQRQETDLFRAHVTAETGKNMRSLYDLVPPIATRATGTYGGVARPTNFTNDVPDAGNTWWTPKYQILTADPEVNLLSDIKNFYNDVTDQIETPDGCITSQNLFEIYLEFGLDQTQIVGNSELLKLGFSAAKYLDMDIVWSKNQTTDDMRFLNSRWIKMFYDPYVWFMMTDWKDVPNQLERICYILCTQSGPITNQPRRHGLLYTT